MSIDNSNNGNICNLTCPVNKGIFLFPEIRAKNSLTLEKF